MSGENCTFSAPGFSGTTALPSSSVSFWVVNIWYGIEMDYVEKESRTNRTVYFSDRLDDNFEVSLIFKNYDDYYNAATWFQYYGTVMSSPANSTVSPMKVSMPYINFVGVGIPTQGITFGDEVPEITYTMNIAFEGGYDSLDSSPSTYQAPKYTGQDQYFYPSGTQQGSAVSTNEQILYDSPSTLTASNAPANSPINPSGGTGTDGPPAPSNTYTKYFSGS
jgi:hypothetical protein